MSELKDRVLQFLYQQVNENKIPQIRKGMCEDFEQFVIKELERASLQQASSKMQQAYETQQKEVNNDQNS